MNSDKNIEKKIEQLSKSKFRSSFTLNKKMRDYVVEKGYDVIEKHAYDFVDKRLRYFDSDKDGKQTPMRQVHPIFIAQHACACCCRGCLNKWHAIDKYKELDKEEIDYIVRLLMMWIRKEMLKYEKRI